MITAEAQAAALAQIKAVYDDGIATINGRDYKFHPTTHKVRRKIFGFLSKVQGHLQRGDFSWMDGHEFDAVEDALAKMVTVDGMELNKVEGHWDKHPGDYLTYVTTALQVVSYPFLGESLGGSTSAPVARKPTT